MIYKFLLLILYMNLSSFVFFLLSIYMNYLNIFFFFEWKFFYINSVVLEFVIFFDWMSLMFLFIVFLISSMVFLYSIDYMSEDNNINRFMILVFLFVFSMMMMILSPNLISILLGWDGLGLTSYCLVIYYQSYSSFCSGMITVMLNRFGDVMLLMSIGFLFFFGSWNLIYNYKNIFMIMMLISIASFTKSAQIPFSSWLTAAMAAPTPVSSLVHSSTLVTAGVYLLIRFNNMIKISMNIQFMILFISLMTMFMSGLSACFQNDFKKIIALSTLSQLGLMMSSLALGMIMMSFFHLLMHALFKSLLFMCAGQVIHKSFNFQDIRKFGSVMKFMPYVSMCFFSSTMALMGFPFLSGFFSKDLILETMMMNGNSIFMMFMYFFSMLLTMIYSIRLMMYVFMKNYMMLSLSMMENYKFMNLSMILLFFFSIILGGVMSWLLVFNFIYYFIKSMKLFLLVMMMLFMFFFFLNFICKMNKYNFMKFFMNKMWFMDYVSFNFMFMLNMGGIFYFFFEKGWNELYSGVGITKILNYMIKKYLI
uniref:NADH:ubiquinone reductase (H(+)-translocating) n=1 Tax=Foenatopus ruficollis TaxID=1738635 RepID=A0A342I4E6_9HYME|nr:NADH dehydrogenase subunit 5 [Foenatopus ruficollis]